MDRKQIVVVFSIITILVVSSIAVVLFLGTPDDSINFYVFGDSQGYQGGIEQIVTTANLNRPDFIFHCWRISGLTAAPPVYRGRRC